MLSLLIYASNSLTFDIKGTVVTVSGNGAVTSGEIAANSDRLSTTEFIFSDGITSISSDAFRNYRNLIRVTISKTVQTVMGNAFRYCLVFSEFVLDPDNPCLELDEYGALYYKGKESLIKIPGLKTEWSAPPTLKTIGEQAFSSSQIQSLLIPKSVTSIGTYATVDSSIRYLSYEKGTKIIGINATVYLYSGFYTVSIPPSVEYILNNAFSYCASLSNVIFEEGSKLTTIGNNAFAYTVISNFTFPPNVSSIGSNIFNMNSRIQTVHIPLSVVSIDIQAFSGVSTIASITIDKGHQYFTVSPPATLMSTDGNNIYYINPKATEFIVPKGMTSIPSTLLQGCLFLTNVKVAEGNKNYYASNGILYNYEKTSVCACAGGVTQASLLSTVTNINSYAFSGLTNLKSVTLNDKLETISDLAFYKIKNFYNITFPASLKTIGSAAFQESSLMYPKFLGDGPTTVGDAVFYRSQIREIEFGRNLNSLGVYNFLNTPLTKITFHPDCTITRFRDRQLSGTKITTLELPKSLKILEAEAVSNCYSLSTLIIHGNITYIGNLAFLNDPIKTITIPNCVTYIGSSAFAGNSALTNLVFDPVCKLTEFGAYAWKDCTSLKTVSIPSTITSFDASIFIGCLSLTSIFFDPANKNYKTINGIVYTINGEKLITCPAGLAIAEVNNEVSTIGSNAFYQCSKLKTLTFLPGSKLAFIEELTFFSCTSLTRIDLPTSLRTVQRNAFAGCTSLSIITLPDNSLCNLDADSIFEDCVSLQYFSFGKFCSLTVFGPSTFKGCTHLQNITIPANCTTIGANCFEGCTSLNLVSYEPGSHLSSIGENAFLQCTSLVNYHIPDAFDSISSNVFGNAPSIANVFVSANKRIQSIASNAFKSFPIQTITFGSGTTVDYIHDSAFENKPLKSFTMNSALTICAKAFKNCASLTTVEIDKVTRIGNNAFSGCSSLQSITIPSSCSDIGISCFEFCSKLTTVTIHSNSLLRSINKYVFNGCGLTQFTLPQTITSLGEGSFQDCAKLSSFTFSGEISSISASTFNGCTTLNSITIPASVTDIGNSAFQGCSSLNTITFNRQSKMQTIGSDAFSGCTKLTTFTVPDSFTTISSSIFGNAPSITKVIVHDGIKISSILRGSFSGFDLRYFIIGPSTTIDSIDESAFENQNIENFTVCNPVKLGNSAFKGCKFLSTISLNTINSFGSFAFSCTAIQSITLSLASNIKSIPNGSFENCTKLRIIEIYGTIESIGTAAFKNCESLDFQRIDTITSIGDFSFYKSNSIKLPPKLSSIGIFAFFGTFVKDSNNKIPSYSITLPSSLTSIGTSSFLNTGIKVVLYCGSRDFSENRKVFPAGTEVRATFKYEYSTMFTLHVDHYEGTSCDSLYATGINNAADFRTILLKKLGCVIFQVCVCM